MIPKRWQKKGQASENGECVLLYDESRTNVILTNIDEVDVVGWGGEGLTFADAFPLPPGTPGGVISLTEEDAQAALYIIADSGKTPDYHLTWVSPKR
jgi:hypothetical protein